jgi:hypothetical protein
MLWALSLHGSHLSCACVCIAGATEEGSREAVLVRGAEQEQPTIARPRSVVLPCDLRLVAHLAETRFGVFAKTF